MLMNYLIKVDKISESDIIIIGRSLGSGPATYLASKYSPFALLLIHPLSSLKNAVKQKVGVFSAFVK